MNAKLQQAKRSGSTLKLSCTTFAFTGPSGAGKTSFLNLLNKRKFLSHHHSTGVVESENIITVRQARTVGSGEKSKWIELNHHSMLVHLNKHLERVPLPKRTDAHQTKKLSPYPMYSVFLMLLLQRH